MICIESTGIARGAEEAGAPASGGRRRGHGFRNVRMVGGCGSARRLADRLRDERWGVRAGRRYGARSGRERRGGLDRPGRLRGRGDIPDGVRRLRRGGHRDHRPPQVAAHRASGAGIPALRGTWAGNPNNPTPPAIPWGAGTPFNPNSVNTPFGMYGNPSTPNSATNPNAPPPPMLFDQQGNYRGNLTTNPYDPNSISNPYGRYGDLYSPDSINNPFGAGDPNAPNNPTNP